MKPGLAELHVWGILRMKLLTRAEWHRRQAKERAKRRAAFRANPFGLTKQLLGQKRSGHLTCSKEEVDSYLHDTYSDVAWVDGGPWSMQTPHQSTDTGHLLQHQSTQLERYSSCCQGCQNQLSMWPQWCATSCVQEVPQALVPSVEDPEGYLEERESCPTMEICRRSVGSKGRKVNQH